MLTDDRLYCIHADRNNNAFDRHSRSLPGDKPTLKCLCDWLRQVLFEPHSPQVWEARTYAQQILDDLRHMFSSGFEDSEFPKPGKTMG